MIRTLLSIPVRLITAFSLAWLISDLAILYCAVYQQPLLDAMVRRGGPASPILLAYVGSLLFFIVLVALLVVLSRVKAHVLKKDSRQQRWDDYPSLALRFWGRSGVIARARFCGAHLHVL